MQTHPTAVQRSQHRQTLLELRQISFFQSCMHVATLQSLNRLSLHLQHSIKLQITQFWRDVTLMRQGKAARLCVHAFRTPSQ